MRNYGLIFSLLAAMIVGAIGITWQKGLKLGIDLSGGTILVYKVKESTRTGGNTMDELIAALQKRVNPEGTADLPIRKVGNNRVEIILANATPEEVERLKRKITDVGSMEFRILANRKHDEQAIRRALASPINKPPAQYKWVGLGEIITGKNPKLRDAASFTDPSQNWVRDRYKTADVSLTGKDASGKEVTRNLVIKSNTEDTVTLERPHGLASISSYTINYNPSKIGPSDDAIVRDEPGANGHTDRYLLVKMDRYDVTGDYLVRPYPTTDERVQPAVGFKFNSQGARKFGGLTGSHLPEEAGQFKYRLGVILDNLIRSAPSLNSRITDSGIIEGVQPDEVTYLIEILRSGSLPASLYPVPELEEKIGSTLGQDTIEKGLRAIFISMVTVPIFMISYYHFAGVVSVVALVMNMILLIASMAVTDSSFTLPGLAGLALTIGMAVDANVLIFERMREEKERGATLGQQIRNGFSRAWVTIFDSHITIFLSGLVLWWVGTQEVKGFALTLVIGMIWNLFTAVYVSHVIFDFFYARGWLKKITMVKILDKTQINFIGPRYYFITASCIVILLGLGATWWKYHNGQLLNIDFTGGTLVTIQLDQDAPEIKKLGAESRRSAFVRTQAETVLRDASVETIHVGPGLGGEQFNIRTTEDNTADVQRKIFEKFKPVLARLKLELSAPTPIAGTPAPATSSDTKKDAPAPTTGDRFAGGESFELRANRTVQPSTVQAALVQVLREAKISNPERHFELSVIQPKPDAKEVGSRFFVKIDLAPAEAQKVLGNLLTNLQNDPGLMFERLENFGGAVAGETRTLAIVAIILSWLIIIGFLWFRFKSVAYGVAAVIALIHDVLVALGAVAISPYKIDLPMVCSFLTLIGFSTNDTIVIFDRIREIKGKTPNLDPNMINAAINQTLSPYHPDDVDGLARGRDHVPVRRRGSEGVHLLPGRWLPERCLQHGRHRQPDPGRLDRQGPRENRQAQAGGSGVGDSEDGGGRMADG